MVFSINLTKRMQSRKAATTSPDVFLSFSRKDLGQAEQICHALEVDNFRCWMPHRDIKPGHGYLGPVLEAADRCRAVAVIISPNTSEASIFVVDRVAARGVPIIWIIIDQVQLSTHFKMYQESAVVIDASVPPLELHLPSIAARLNSLLNPKKITSDRLASEPQAEHSTVDRLPNELAPPQEQLIPPIDGGIRPGDVDDEAIEIALRTASEVLTGMTREAGESAAKPNIAQQQRSSSPKRSEGVYSNSQPIPSSRKRQRTRATFVVLFIGLAVVAFGVGALLHTQIFWVLHVTEGYSTRLSRVH